MTIVKGKIGNALTSTATDHTVAVADDLYDESLNKYQSEINQTAINDKVDKIQGKGLSTEDYTTEEQTKLGEIESGAQVNVIEIIKKNGTTISINNKSVDISVPTKTSDITNNSGFIKASIDEDILVLE